MFNFQLIEKLLFPKRIVFFYRLFLILLNGCLEIIGISLLLLFIKIISSNEDTIEILHYSFKANNLSDIVNFSLFVIIFYLLKNFYVFWFIISQQRILTNAQLRLSKNIYYGYIKSKLNKIININTKKIIQDINVETEKLFYEYFQSLFTLITETIIILLILIFFLYNEPLISIYLVSLSLVIYFSAAKIFFNKSSDMGQKRIESFEKLSNIVNASIGLFKELKVMKKINLFSNKFDKDLSIYVKSRYFDNITSELPKTFIEVFIVSVIISIVIILILLNQTLENLIPTLSMFAIGSIRIMPSINRVAVASHNMKFYGETISQLVFDLDYFNYTKDRTSLKKNNFIKNKIEFKNVGYSLEKKNIFYDLNLKISYKDKILILGKSGSGKTSFLKILAGLVPITDGYINSGMLKNYSFLRFKEPISFLSQENFIVDKKSIYYNITLRDKNESSKKDLENFKRVSKIANLVEFFSKLQLKEDTILNEGASNISGGERQRICIARSLFSNNKLIIMDEPFSSIDKQNSDEIFQNILRECKDKTLILSNHKIINKNYFNKVLYFQKGKKIKIHD